jgi:hypothetical protein
VIQQEPALEDTTPKEDKEVIKRSGVTAFLLIKLDNGVWTAVTDLSTPLAVDRNAVVTDIKQGCGEIADSIRTQETAWAISQYLQQTSGEDSQRVGASVRDALDRRQI